MIANTITGFDKKKDLFLKQKETLDTFLKTGAITQLQYNKSYGDLVKKMGMERNIIFEENISISKLKRLGLTYRDEEICGTG